MASTYGASTGTNVGAIVPSNHMTGSTAPSAAASSSNPSSNTSASGQYSPISTLERQYAPPIGRRLTVIVRANPACRVDGGVEAVLKASSSVKGGGGGGQVGPTSAVAGVPQQHQQQLQLGPSGSGEAMASSEEGYPVDLMRFDSSVSIASSGGGDGGQDAAVGQQGNVPNGGGGSGDPFGFLGESTTSSTGRSSTSSGRASSGSGGGNKLLGGLSSKLARAARGAQDHIERGVTTMAIRADKNKAGRKRPDVLTVGAFVQTPFGERCVGMTEELEIPGSEDTADAAAAASADGVTSGSSNKAKEMMAFAIPIVISPPDMAAGGPGSDFAVEFRLYIKSGATMLAKALQKRFVVGTGSVAVSHLQSTLSSAAPPGSNTWSVGRCTVPLVGPALPPPAGPHSSPDGGAAALDLFVAPDTKFSLLCGVGWTLADPRVDTAYLGGGTTGGPLFNYPLDQSYCYALSSAVGTTTAGGVLVATERVTESSVVLPLAVACAKLFSEAASRSTNHTSDVARTLRDNDLKFDDPMRAMEAGHAQCQLDVAYVLRGTPGSDDAASFGGASAGMGMSSNRATVTVNMQRPDSIFESELGGASVPLYQYDASVTYPTNSPAPLSVPFYPRVCTEGDPRLLPGLVASRASSGTAPAAGQVFVGTVRVEIREEGIPNGGPNSVAYPASAMTLVAEDPNAFAPAEPRIMDAYVDIDPILNNPDGKYAHVPMYDRKTGKAAGVVVMSLQAHTRTPASSAMRISKPTPNAPARGGLVSLVGLDTLTEGMDCHPHLDYDADFPAAAPCPSGTAASPEDQAVLARRRRMATMGDFMSHSYVQYHLTSVRSVDMNKLIDRYNLYKGALSGSGAAAAGFEVPSNQRKDPRPFRPSSSRMDAPLAGLPFNVHVQTLSLTTLTTAAGGCANVTSRPVALFHNVTHGAPSAHARGFSGPPDQTAAGVSGARGGLRRLEAARLTAVQRVRDTQNDLIHAVAQYFSSQARQQPPPGGAGSRSRHVPVSDAPISRLRRVVMESVQALHALTWDVAVRRAAVFSQALGIGVTSYLSHLSDAAKVGASTGGGGGWPDVWKRHGFLITFEGLLSAAGKELGMIEDASVGIGMLRMVSMVLVSDNGQQQQQQRGVRVPVPHSPYLKSVTLIPSGVGSGTNYRLEIGIDPGYYGQRIPAALRDGAAVKFYPVLFQMGVDIRQWGANAGMNVKNQMQQQQLSRRDSAAEDEGAAAAGGGGGLLDDEDDDVGIADNDVLIALNFEAFHKMNAYSHAIMPTPNAAIQPQTWEQANIQQSQQQQQQVAVHPTVAKLNDYIRSSAGKMEHGVLDEAANVAARLGGGAAIFCKSGKDRTAMQVTFKQAQFVNRYLIGEGGSDAVGDNSSKISPEKVFADATLMRIHGTRLPICEKNVGQAKFAFNSLQAKFMPEMLKPPPSTLAGFLKGGKVFSREGGIES